MLVLPLLDAAAGALVPADRGRSTTPVGPSRLKEYRIGGHEAPTEFNANRGRLPRAIHTSRIRCNKTPPTRLPSKEVSRVATWSPKPDLKVLQIEIEVHSLELIKHKCELRPRNHKPFQI